MELPEGLHLQLDGEHDPIEIVDAQGHAWITLWPRAIGDPHDWEAEILRRILFALDIGRDES